VVSGINNGANMGDDTIYSGTVGAAMEGYLFGMPGDRVFADRKGLGPPGRGGPKAAELVQPPAAVDCRPTRRPRRAALAAQREHSVFAGDIRGFKVAGWGAAMRPSR
jgi:hypothetical protein